MQEPIFVPKQENQVTLDLDESLDLIVQAQEEQKKLKKKLDNLKAVAKAHLKQMGVRSYENEKGRKAKWSERQQPKYDREKMRQLLGDDYGGCLHFETINQFKVT